MTSLGLVIRKLCSKGFVLLSQQLDFFLRFSLLIKHSLHCCRGFNCVAFVVRVKSVDD